MKYISTRGGISPISFKEAVMMGLATDGGLLLPESIPQLSKEERQRWSTLSYRELASAVFAKFVDDIPLADLNDLVRKSYASFDCPEVVSLVKHGNTHILELFHGPTLAFKDIALQFLGNLFEYLLNESGSQMNIVGATSGDTGSAAIYGVRGKDNINIFILHPHKRVSPIQELQMTSVLDANVFNVAIEGTFDDGQNIVKSIFNDISFKEAHKLGAVNSINWARILAQVVYYISTYFRVSSQEGADTVDFSVPTGNFGDIFAGFVARSMLGSQKIGRLILATNENDILSRFILHGDYSISEVTQTVSPSMDIQMASNFERYLYYLYDQNPARTKSSMTSFMSSGVLHFDEAEMSNVAALFSAKKVTEKEITQTIRDFFSEYSYVLDPHTAVGVNAGKALQRQDVPMVCLATAHPGKFSDAVDHAIGKNPLPDRLNDLLDKETRCQILPADSEVVKQFIERHAL